MTTGKAFSRLKALSHLELPAKTFAVKTFKFDHLKQKYSVCQKYMSDLCVIKTDKPVVRTETWLTPESTSSEILPKDLDYNMFRSDQTTGTGGGVFILP